MLAGVCLVILALLEKLALKVRAGCLDTLNTQHWSEPDYRGALGSWR